MKKAVRTVAGVIHWNKTQETEHPYVLRHHADDILLDMWDTSEPIRNLYHFVHYDA